jgi:hypothetical protein
MPEIEFTIDAATGDLTMHVKGIAGPACEDVAKVASELLGVPAREQNSSEYFVRPQVHGQIRTRQGS